MAEQGPTGDVTTRIPELTDAMQDLTVDEQGHFNKTISECAIHIKSVQVPQVRPLCENIRSQLKALNSRQGVAFFGQTGVGKSTLLNTLLAIDLLPSKDNIAQTQNQAEPVTACLVEVIRREHIQGYRLSVRLVEASHWKTILMNFISGKDYTGFSCYKPTSQTHKNFVSTEWGLLPEEGEPRDLLTKLVDKVINDPIQTYLNDNRLFTKTFQKDVEARRFLKDLVTNKHPLSALIASVTIEGSFPKSQLPIDISFYDVPGSQDPILSRKVARQKALEQTKWAVLVVSNNAGQIATREDFREVLATDPNPIVVQSFYWQNSRSFENFWYGEFINEDIDPVDISDDERHRIEALHSTPQEVVQNLLAINLTEVLSKHLQEINKDRQFPYSLPNRLFLLDRVLNHSLNNKQNGTKIMVACKTFLESQMMKLVNTIREVVSGKDNYFLQSLEGISTMVGMVLNGAVTKELQDPNQQLPLVLEPLKASFEACLLKSLDVDSFVNWLRDVYVAMHNPHCHKRMRLWANNSGRCYCGSQSFNTPEVLARWCIDHLKKSPEFKERFRNLSVFCNHQCHSLQNFWERGEELVEEAIYTVMAPYYVKPYNDCYKAYEKKSMKGWDYITKLCNKTREIFRTQILPRLVEVKTALFKPVYSELYSILLLEYQKKMLNRPVIMSSVDKVFKQTEIAAIQLGVVSAQKLLSLLPQRCAPVPQWNPENKSLYFQPNLSSDRTTLEVLSANLTDKRADIEALILRFCNILDKDLEVLSSLLHDGRVQNFPSLKVIDISGNPSLSAGALLKFQLKFAHLHIYCRFCLNPSETDPTMLEKIKLCAPTLVSTLKNTLFQGKKLAYLIANLNYTPPMPSAEIDGRKMQEFLQDHNFTTEVLQLHTADEWRALLASITRAVTSSQEPVALLFSFSGHGCQENALSYLQTTNTDLVCIGELYDALKEAPAGSHFVFLLNCCQVQLTPKQGSAAKVPKNSLLLRGARLNEEGWTWGAPTALLSPYFTAVLDTFNNAPLLPVYTLLGNIQQTYQEQTTLCLYLESTGFHPELRLW